MVYTPIHTPKRKPVFGATDTINMDRAYSSFKRPSTFIKSLSPKQVASGLVPGSGGSGWQGEANRILDPGGIFGGLFGSEDQPSKSDFLNYYYGKAGRLREKATAAGFHVNKSAKYTKKADKAEAASLKLAQEMDQKHGIAGPKTFADLVARRAAYQEKIENPPPKGQVRTILRSL